MILAGAGGAVGFLPVGESIPVREPGIEAVIGADPDAAGAIFKQSLHGRTGEGGRVFRVRLELPDGPAIGRDQQQAPESADPDIVLAVPQQALDGRIDPKARVDAKVFEAEEDVPVGVVDGEAATEGADPQPVLAVLEDRFDLVIADGVGIAGVVAKDGKGIAVVPVEAILGADPQEAVAVAKDAIDAAL